jgi:mono/diheme cytochrome c family protein
MSTSLTERSLMGGRTIPRVVSLLLVAGFGARVPFGYAQQARSVVDGVYSSAQAGRGEALYRARCRSCHGAALEGASGPPLTGEAFVRVWSTGPLADLVDKIQHTMPEAQPGSLSRTQATDLVAAILQAGKVPAGGADLSADDAALKLVTWPAAATVARPPQAVGLSGGLTSLPLGNLAQIMRGIFFPSSNIIFNAQTQDPGAPKPAYDAANRQGFSWVDWGGGIYSGWQMVDYAAIALAEASPMMLMPGRRCENGRPVPVDRPDWIRFSQEMIDAARAAYRATQSRSQDAVTESTDRLAEACLACHRVYRDRGRGPAGDPSNKASRCVADTP